jgi:hypothetical protein
VAVLFSSENILAPLIVVMSTVLFFVRVNQVLVRLWARVIDVRSGVALSAFRQLITGH